MFFEVEVKTGRLLMLCIVTLKFIFLVLSSFFFQLKYVWFNLNLFVPLILIHPLNKLKKRARERKKKEQKHNHKILIFFVFSSLFV